MEKTIKDLLFLAMVTALISVLIWLPHILGLHSFFNLDFSSGFSTIYRNFDGLEYVVVAKSFYNPLIITQLPQSMNPIYYASHFPLYPLFISLKAPFFGYLKSMLLESLAFTILSAWAFYFLVRDFRLTDHPLLLSTIFLILPARWLIVHSIGSPEPVFIFFILLSVYFLMKYERLESPLYIWASASAGLLAQLTRPPGILLFIAVMFYIHWKMFKNFKKFGSKKAFLDHLKYFPFLLIPLGLIGVFYLFNQNYADPLAFFHSGDNIHLTFPPFQVFNKHQFWVGDIWLEDVIYIFLLGFLGGLYLLKNGLFPAGFFVLTYMSASIFVAHRDISRYTLPIMPLVIIAFEKVLTSKEFRIVLIILSLGIYLYSQNFIIENVAPISNLSAFN